MCITRNLGAADSARSSPAHMVTLVYPRVKDLFTPTHSDKTTGITFCK